MTDGAELLAALRRRGWSVACAESLTGGLVCAELTAVPGASATVRGGVVAYATDCKVSVLGVDPALTARVGAVDPDVADQMAEGVRRLFAAEVGIATTGVAGPDPQDGQPVGTVHVSVATPGGIARRRLALSGTREEIRAETVRSAVLLAVEAAGRDPWE
ncbi:CinA family protein [Microbacterium aurantiacum]|uniref:CinA family protein n=1 Tax=Microbacterium aurantiacum TaxID=162393 RepID=UPI001F00D522|nr:nicotinamide-nucleotide amidohydrolase family protein [Microbacterium aurantiacum]